MSFWVPKTYLATLISDSYHKAPQVARTFRKNPKHPTRPARTMTRGRTGKPTAERQPVPGSEGGYKPAASFNSFAAMPVATAFNDSIVKTPPAETIASLVRDQTPSERMASSKS